ncbi:hypothetical protein Tco_1266430 [Tanacetum coccineum]
MEELMREWMDSQMEANERMKNHVVELERQIKKGLRNRQAIVKNLERQFEYLNKKVQHTKSLPCTTNTKLRHKFVYKPPLIRNKNDKDGAMHIPYSNAKTFTNDVLLNNVGDKELKLMDGVGYEVLTKMEIKKDDKGMPKEPNQEWKLNEKVVD